MCQRGIKGWANGEAERAPPQRHRSSIISVTNLGRTPAGFFVCETTMCRRRAAATACVNLAPHRRYAFAARAAMVVPFLVKAGKSNCKCDNCELHRQAPCLFRDCVLIFRSQYGGQRRVVLFAEFINETATPSVGGVKDL